MKIIFTAALIFLTIIVTHAQLPSKVIEIDSITLTPKEPLPFDQAFTLKIPITGKKVSFVYIVQQVLNFDLKQSVEQRLLNNQKAYETFPKSYFKVEIDEKKKNYLFVDFKSKFLLEPNKRYTLIFSAGPNEKTYEIFDSYRKLKRGLTTDSVFEKKYLDLSDAIADRFDGLRFNYTTDINIAKKNVDSLYNASLKIKYDKIDALLTSLDSSIAISNLHVLFNGNPNLNDFLKIIASANAAIDEKFREKFMLNNETLNMINELHRLDIDFYKKTLNGYLSIGCRYCEAIDTLKYSERIKMIDKSIDSLSRLETLSRSLSVNFASQISISINISAYLKELRTSKKILKEIEKLLTDIKNEISKDPKFNVAELVEGHSFAINFAARSAYSIVPDFGLVNTRLFANGRENDYKFMPYLGFHVNLRPINKDLHFWSYKHKNLFHFLSIFVGWTLVKVESSKRLDFFENSSLLTGFGFRLGNALRLVGGKMWYFNVDTNGIRNFSNMNFAGLSLDFELEKLFNGFKDLKPNKISVTN
ncbi:hypothetical protein [Emticicia fontis]